MSGPSYQPGPGSAKGRAPALHPTLATPLDIRGVRCPTRIVMAPMVTGMAGDHTVGDAHLAWYGERAAAGIGLVIVESSAIAPDAMLVERTLGAWEDSHIRGLARLAHEIGSHGVPALVQIVHGGARSWRADPDAQRPGPSDVAVMPGYPPRPMSEAEIEAVIADFAAAARRVIAAGFAGVEIHAAHYYLLSQFLSPRTNHRTDRWGGDLAGRARLALEVIRAVRRAIGAEALLAVRMHAVELVQGGLSTADAVILAAMFQFAGVDLIDASGIGQSAWVRNDDGGYLQTTSAPVRGAAPGTYLAATREVRHAVTIPVIGVGKLGEVGVAQRALDDGSVDMVALARQLIADPRAAAKLIAGRDADINRCEECFACFSSIRRGPVRCAVHSDES